jgi:acetyl-CoA carboxylase carboxyl transferase subunit alpha
MVPEPLGGAHRDPAKTIEAVGDAVEAALSPLLELTGPALKSRRRERFLQMGRDLPG